MFRWTEESIGVAIVVAIVALIVAYLVVHVHARNECEDRGGTYEQYNCTTSYITNSCGNGCFYTTPIEICSYRCVGGTP